MKEWIKSLITASAVANLTLSTLVGGLAGYYADHLKGVRAIYSDEATKFAFAGDDFSDAARKYISSIGQETDNKQTIDDLKTKIVAQMHISDQIGYLFHDEPTKLLLVGYQSRLSDLDDILQKPHTARDLGKIESTIDKAATARRQLAKRLLDRLGVDINR